MKEFFLFLCSLILTFSWNMEKDFFAGTRFKSVKCKTDNETMILKYCNIKAYSRKIVVFNLGVKILKTLKRPIYIQTVLNYRYGNIFRPVITMSKQEWCGTMVKFNFYILFTIFNFKIF